MNNHFVQRLQLFVRHFLGGFMAVGYEKLNASAAPRGIRNNNPGNIKRGDNWRGMKKIQADPVFVQFKAPKWGIRAIVRILDNYAKRGVVYMADIIQTWAPATENNVRAYIESVEKSSGLFGNEVITREKYPKLIAAIIKHENGFNPYPESVIKEGIALA